MDLDVNLEKGTFDAMIPGIEAKRFEVIGSINDFKERQKTIDFIDYLKTGTAVLVAADHEGTSWHPPTSVAFGWLMDEELSNRG